uniref:Putative conserved secreted protein n=1 Tax=Culex tarsalis TaxID=7177 RepID=A0A1Q3FSM9_CULTA
MFKLVLISALVALAACTPTDKPAAQQGLETSETMWNAAWVDPRVAPVAAAATATPWNRWNNPAAAAAVDPRWNRWGAAPAAADPWNRWGANPAAWNRAAPVVPAAAAAVAGNRAWYPW